MNLYPGSHVTIDAGTGLVHTAPSHGQEDYLLGLENNLDLSCPVNDQGCYDDSVLSGDLKGLEVLGSGNDKMIELLVCQYILLLLSVLFIQLLCYLILQGQNVLKKTKFQHSYPYDWRTKKPVILRGSQQWFIDTKSLKSKALDVIQRDVTVEPKNMFQGFESILKSRPYWCVSRQRVWGVPIPVFYDKNDNVIITDAIIERLCELTEKHGNIDFWWEMSAEEILNGLDEFSNVELTKGHDILDVWFDSGMTWNAVVPKNVIDGQVADLYLEGLDQFSGWFYSSLLTSLAAQGRAPYKSIFVHGFALDENGRKMSKSLGNVVAPKDIVQGTKKTPAYGVDTLRYWVAAHACRSANIQVSDKVMSLTKQETDKLRNYLRFAISNIESEDHDLVPLEQMKIVDRYMLHRMAVFYEKLSASYDTLFLNRVCQLTQNFTVNELSGFYYSIIKDRLYCDEKSSLQRQSALTALYHIATVLVKALNPIMPVMAEEIAQVAPRMRLDFVQPLDLDLIKSWKDDSLAEPFQEVQDILKNLNQSNIKKSDAVLIKPNDRLKVFSENDLTEIFQVSFVQFDTESNQSFEIVQSHDFLCPRCRLYQAKIEGELCNRCVKVVKNL